MSAYSGNRLVKLADITREQGVYIAIGYIEIDVSKAALGPDIIAGKGEIFGIGHVNNVVLSLSPTVRVFYRMLNNVMVGLKSLLG